MSSLGNNLASIIAATLPSVGMTRSVTLTTVTAGAYDPATGAATPTTTTKTVNATVEEYDGADLLAGLGAQGDKKVSVPAAQLATAPKPTDTVSVGGVAYAVVTVRTDELGGVPVLYTLQCRKA